MAFNTALTTDSQQSVRNNVKKRKHVILFYFNRIFLLAALVVLAVFLYKEKEQYYELLSRADYWLVLSSCAVMTLFAIVQSFLSAFLLRTLGEEIPYVTSMKVILQSLLGKYIPGKIGVATMRGSFYMEHNVSLWHSMTTLVWEHVYLFGSGILIFILPRLNVPYYFIVLGYIFTFCIIVLLPYVICRILSRFVKRFDSVNLSPSLSNITKHIALLAGYVGTWFALGAGIYLAALSVLPELDSANYLKITGDYAISVLGGFIALFAPGGIGVREGLFVFNMKSVVTVESALLIAVMARIIYTAAEVGALIFIYIVEYASKRVMAYRMDWL